MFRHKKTATTVLDIMVATYEDMLCVEDVILLLAGRGRVRAR